MTCARQILTLELYSCLQHLHDEQTGEHHPLPSELSMLVNLRELDVSNVDGPLPESWASLTKLQQLDISSSWSSAASSNFGSRVIPGSWAQMANLMVRWKLPESGQPSTAAQLNTHLHCVQ